MINKVNIESGTSDEYHVSPDGRAAGRGTWIGDSLLDGMTPHIIRVMGGEGRWLSYGVLMGTCDMNGGGIG